MYDTFRNLKKGTNDIRDTFISYGILQDISIDLKKSYTHIFLSSEQN